MACKYDAVGVCRNGARCVAVPHEHVIFARFQLPDAAAGAYAS